MLSPVSGNKALKKFTANNWYLKKSSIHFEAVYDPIAMKI